MERESETKKILIITNWSMWEWEKERERKTAYKDGKFTHYIIDRIRVHRFSIV